MCLRGGIHDEVAVRADVVVILVHVCAWLAQGVANLDEGEFGNE